MLRRQERNRSLYLRNKDYGNKDYESICMVCSNDIIYYTVCDKNQYTRYCH